MTAEVWSSSLRTLCCVVLYFGIVNASGLNVKYEWKTLDFAYPNQTARDDAIRTKTYIPENNVPVGLEIWRNRLFVTVPRWKSGVPASLAYIDLKNSANEKSPKLIPYPDWSAHNLTLDISPRFGGDEGVRIVSPFRIRADACNRLWVLDTGKTNILGSQEQFGPNQLLVYNLMTDTLIHKYDIPSHFMKNDSFFANIAVDVNNKDCEGGFAYLADLGAFAMVVFSWRTKTAWRVTHNFFMSDPLAGKYDVAGVSFQWTDGLFGLALSGANPDGYRTLYFHPFSSFSEFSVSTRVLQNESLWQKPNFMDRKTYEEFKYLGSRKKNTQSCASFLDEKSGVLFYTQVTQNSVGCWNTHRPYTPKTQGQVAVVNEVTMVFPNDIKVDEERNLWVLTDKMALFMYKGLKNTDVNFNILTAPVDEAISGTICSLTVSPGNVPTPMGCMAMFLLSSIVLKYFV